MMHSHAFAIDTARRSRTPALRRVVDRLARARSLAIPSVDAAPVELDRAAALSLVDAGYMPLQRYVELFDERLVTPPYNGLNFGEGDV